MPVWLAVLLGIVGWAVWPALIVVLHVSEERRVKKNTSKGDKFMENLRRDK